MAVLTYRGSIPEIQGQKFDVPDSVPQTSRAKWIESTWREEQARATAEAEREAREQRLLQERIESTRQQNAIDSLASEIGELNGKLQELDQRIVAEPDTSAQLQFNAAAADIYNRSLGLADEVAAMQATVTDLLTRATAMAEAAAIGEELQQQALNLLRNQQLMMNGSFETYASELQRLRDETNSAIVEVGELNTAAEDNREVIEQAANIREEAVNIARQEANSAVSEMRDEFLDLMALSLRALGLTEMDLITTANAIEVEPNNSATIRRSSVERFIEVSRSVNASIEKARGEVIG